MAMANEKRSGAANALNKFFEKQESDRQKEISGSPRKKHNKAPEKDVEKACLAWMRARGWTVNVYEAAARWNSDAGHFTSSGMRFGTSDCMGNTDEGIAVAVEFKSPGRLSTFNSEERYLQRKFIIDRINTNAFSCVVDSVERLEMIYSRWHELRSDLGAARNYLLSMLPQESEKSRLKKERLFDEE